LNNPKYVKIDEELYEINTDFRVALKCNEISNDNAIGDHERALAIIYTLFGEKGLKSQRGDKLLELGLKYLNMNKELPIGKPAEEQKDELDFTKCKGLIKSSFKYDYGYDPYELDYLHWYEFYNDLENLSNNEFGTCCVLNRITNLLNTDTKEIKDKKQRTQIKKAQEEIRRLYCKEKETKITKKQEESAREFYKALGIEI